MGFDKAVQIVLDNAQSIGVVAIVLIVFVAFLYAILTERLHIGNEFKRMSKRSDTLDTLVQTMTKELTETKVLLAEARTSIQYLKERVEEDRLELERSQRDIEDLRSRLHTVERERDRIVSTWTPPATIREQG